MHQIKFTSDSLLGQFQSHQINIWMHKTKIANKTFWQKMSLALCVHKDVKRGIMTKSVPRKSEKVKG